MLLLLVAPALLPPPRTGFRTASKASHQARTPPPRGVLTSSELARWHPAPEEVSAATEPQWSAAIAPFAPDTDPFQVAKRLTPQLLFHLLWSLLAAAASCRFRLHGPPLLHSLLGGVLGLLLAFRTNQAYLRYQQLCTCWVDLHRASLNFARNAAQLELETYSAVMRQMLALPIAIKQGLRNQRNEREFWSIMWEQEVTAFPFLGSPRASSVIATLSMLVRPLKASDDGGGRELALWSILERNCDELQAITSRFELLAQLPPPASYSLLVSRFCFAWLSTLPFVLLPLMPCRWLVPPCMLLVAWALYSTEELAQLMEEPCGNPMKPETLPLDQVMDAAPSSPSLRSPTAFFPIPKPQSISPPTHPRRGRSRLEQVCASLVDQLKAQVIVQRRLDRKVAERSWVVQPEDLEFRPRGDAATAGGGGGAPRDAAVGAGPVSWRPPWARAGNDDGGIDTSATEDDDDEVDRDGEDRD